MINKVLVDSSVLVEYIKGNRNLLFSRLLNERLFELFINETVVSEFLLYFLAINGNASPRSLKSSNRISTIFSNHSSYDLLNRFNYLANNDTLIQFVPVLMSTYNLLPNDAIILATCKIHGISKLASHDSDFITPCAEEGIELLREE